MSIETKLRALAKVERDNGASEPSLMHEDSRLLHEELQVHHIELRIQNEELRRIQLELEESRDRYRRLYDEAPAGYLTLSQTGHVLSANATAARLLGIARAELVAKPLSALMERTSADLLHLHLRRVIGEGQRHVCELELVRGDAQHIWVRLESTPSEVDDQPSCRTVFSDVSERRRLEAQVQRSEQLEVIGRLASGVAHEFNNLLMGILGSATAALLNLDGRSSAAQFMRDIKDEAIRGATLTRQLLVLGRPRHSGGVVDVNAVVAQNEQLLRRTLGAEVGLSFELQATNGRVWADLGQIEQVLTNLVVNARDALGPDGHIVVRTTAVTLDEARARQLKLDPGPYVCLAVSDDGQGMSAETQARLFEPFFSTKAVGEGTGLGLSTVYGIVQQSGGCVEVESELGVGTTMRVLLPCTSRELPTAVESAEFTQLGGDATVLVVEDEPLVRQTVARYLTRWGYRVIEACTGIEGLAIIKARADIDLLLTDMVLPELDGSRLAHEATALQPGLRVLYMSAYPKVKLVRERRMPADARALQKPFTEDELLITLQEVLGPAHARAQAQVAPHEHAREGRREQRTLLLVEDDDKTREVTGMLLEDEGFEVFTARAGPEAIEIARELGSLIDVVVSDIGLPNTSIHALLETLIELANPSAIVILSGRSRGDPEVEALPQREDLVYLEKPIMLEALSAAIWGLLER